MRPYLCLSVCWLFILAGNSIGRAQPDFSATSKNNMVATVHPIATQAGLNAFRAGGNAVDAAVAAAVTLGVVDGYNSGLGGGCFFLIRLADGRIIALDGRETAPAAAKRDMYLRDGQANSELSQTGSLAVAIPGALKAFEQALRDYGRLSLAQIMIPAAEIAENGFEVTSVYAHALRQERKKLARFPGSAKILLKPDGIPWRTGDLLRQHDLAESYLAIAEQGSDWFYTGPFSHQVAHWMAKNGGILTADDFHAYRTKLREPIQTSYRDYKIIGFPPPSSGGVHVAQILNILESFDLTELRRQGEATQVHVMAEAMKLAFADRAYWLGDPDFARVPRQLVGKAYARSLAEKIDINAVGQVPSHGIPPNADHDCFEGHTTHLTAADADGNWVAITSTINTRFGSGVIVPGTGILLNNQMDDFAIAPGVPNAFGLIGNENNCVGAGKRPLSSMSPTIVLQDGQPIFTVGAAGGPKIITQVVGAIVNRLDLQMSVPEAIAAPKVHHQWSPEVLFLESTFDQSVVGKLKEMRHPVRVTNQVGVAQAIGYDPAKGLFSGAHDPRVPGLAAGQ